MCVLMPDDFAIPNAAGRLTVGPPMTRMLASFQTRGMSAARLVHRLKACKSSTSAMLMASSASPGSGFQCSAAPAEVLRLKDASHLVFLRDGSFEVMAHRFSKSIVVNRRPIRHFDSLCTG